MAKIYLSPSLQENNIGKGNYGTEEKRMNQIADVVLELLKQHGFTVYRNSPSMSLQQAVADSNSKNVDIHFAIHSNAGGGRGCEVYYTSDRGKKLAEAVYPFVEALTPTNDRGIKHTDKLYELNKTKACAVLIEIAFHDNSDDAIFIINNIESIGKAIAKGICKYFNVTFKEPVQETKGKLYKVQVGAFSIRENADKLVKELKAKGYSPFIVEV